MLGYRHCLLSPSKTRTVGGGLMLNIHGEPSEQQHENRYCQIALLN
jgi:hypothetical protein